MELMFLFLKVLTGLLILEGLVYGIALVALTRIIAKQREDEEKRVFDEGD